MPFGFNEPTIHDVAGFVATVSQIETADGPTASVDLVFLDRSGRELTMGVYMRAGRADLAQAYADAINKVALDRGVVDAERLALITGLPPDDEDDVVVYLDQVRRAGP